MVDGKERRFCDLPLSERLTFLRTSKACISKTFGFGRGTVDALSCGMAKSRDLRVRSFQFAADIVLLCRGHLTSDPIIRRLAYQLVDSAGSVGANLEESGGGQTKPDFIAKQFTALKEARECGSGCV
jgi:hypothetical protein